MFAYVEYEASLRTTVVEHTQVHSVEWPKTFEPIDPDDFDPSETYRVHSCNGDSAACQYLKAKIIHMTDTLEEMAVFLAQRPRRPVVHEEKGSARHEEMARDSPLQHDEDHVRSVQRQQMIEEALRDYELAFASIHTSEKQQLCGVRQNDNQGQGSLTGVQTSNNVVPRNVHMALREKHEALMQDYKELQSENNNLQEMLRSNIFRAEGKLIYAMSSDVAVTAAPALTSATQSPNEGKLIDATSSDVAVTEDPAASSPTQRANAQLEPEETADLSDAEENTDQPEAMDDASTEGTDDDSPHVGSVGPNGKVYAGNGFWFEKSEWDKLFAAPTDSIFCYQAADLFWKREELVTRTVTGTVCNRYRGCGAIKPRPPLTPKKLSTLKAMFRVYIGEDPFAANRMKKVRRLLANRLSELRRRPSLMGLAYRQCECTGKIHA
uniref:BEN domain-containing protein n=1 Tax=Amblyomma maculatum TaxID=34609 RepID=G3MP19_AMBMU